MFCVYKYVKNDTIIYIGRTKALKTRILQHSNEEKFREHLDADIYYFEVPNKRIASAIEAELIRRYRPILNAIVPKIEWSGNFFEEPEYIKFYDPYYYKRIVRGRLLENARKSFRELNIEQKLLYMGIISRYNGKPFRPLCHIAYHNGLSEHSPRDRKEFYKNIDKLVECGLLVKLDYKNPPLYDLSKQNNFIPGIFITD